jgi:hypothetical protein
MSIQPPAKSEKSALRPSPTGRVNSADGLAMLGLARFRLPMISGLRGGPRWGSSTRYRTALYLVGVCSNEEVKVLGRRQRGQGAKDNDNDK